MKPWIYDAGSIDIGEYFSEDAQRSYNDKYLVTPYGDDGIRDFIRAPNIGSSKQVVVAPKGYGKTLFLRYRAQWMRQQHEDSGVIFHPTGKHDIEYLKIELDTDELYRYITPISSADQWSKVWECALLVTACHAAGAQSLDSKALDELFPYKPSTLRVSRNLETVLKAMADRSSLLGGDLTTLRDVFSETGKDVVVVIDNADEMFIPESYKYTRKNRSDSSDDDELGYAYDIMQDVPKSWNDLQGGLLLAIRAIARHAKGLHVYTSLRAEALNQISEQTLLQARDHCTELKYSDNALRRIFIANIEMYDEDQMADPDAGDAIARWLGLEYLEHPYVKTHGGEPETEGIFDFILRHTLYSPRDLMIFGEAIASMLSTESRDSKAHIADALRECINETARTTIFDQWKKTAIPRWSDNYYQSLSQVSSNVLHGSGELSYLDNAIDDSTIKQIPFSEYLYQHGLLGYSYERPDSPCQQRFQTSWKQRLNGPTSRSTQHKEKVIPSAGYYFIHPILNDVIRHNVSDSSKFTPDNKNIVGYSRTYCVDDPTIVVLPGTGKWPELRYKGETICDGIRALSISKLGLITLVYAMHEYQTDKLSAQEIQTVNEKIQEKFGATKKDWLSSLSADSSHLNSNIVKLLDFERGSSLLSCFGKEQRSNLPMYIEVRICPVADLYIDHRVKL